MLTINRINPKQVTLLLFFRSFRRRYPRISAENEGSAADNFLQKQQKQQKKRRYLTARPRTDARRPKTDVG